MPSKMVNISARISHEDAEFISGLDIDGTKTPSDKLRAIIADARKRSRRFQDYSGCYQMIQEIMMPVVEAVRKAELENRIHSELISRIIEWLPDVLAYIVSTAPSSEKPKSTEPLNNLEQGVADRVFIMIESVLQLGITQRCPCYDESAIARRISPVLDLSNVISNIHNKRERENSNERGSH